MSNYWSGDIEVIPSSLVSFLSARFASHHFVFTKSPGAPTPEVLVPSSLIKKGERLVSDENAINL